MIADILLVALIGLLFIIGCDYKRNPKNATSKISAIISLK
jgi:hypothetical protein